MLHAPHRMLLVSHPCTSPACKQQHIGFEHIHYGPEPHTRAHSDMDGSYDALLNHEAATGKALTSWSMTAVHPDTISYQT